MIIKVLQRLVTASRLREQREWAFSPMLLQPPARIAGKQTDDMGRQTETKQSRELLDPTQVDCKPVKTQITSRRISKQPLLRFQKLKTYVARHQRGHQRSSTSFGSGIHSCFTQHTGNFIVSATICSPELLGSSARPDDFLHSASHTVGHPSGRGGP